jgi:pyridoxine 5-phosphate synthase
MTTLSVNLNKIALLRNSRGRDYPNVVGFAEKFIQLGVEGITIHPRPDERHVRRRDAYELGEFLRDQSGIELNIEGYPGEDFLKIIGEVRPDQCTLVPDADNQLTSDHGWNFQEQGTFITDILARINDWGVRTAVFLDPDPVQIEPAAAAGSQRIELYTEAYAKAWGSPQQAEVLAAYREVALLAQSAGLGVNAGHDLDLNNLPDFLAIPGILEVSIGHALTIECLQQGMPAVVQRYLDICRG